MKRTVEIKGVWLISFILILFSSINAQDYYFKATTNSNPANEFYEQAIEAFYRTEYSQMFDLAEKAIQADPNFFMGYFIASLHFQADQKQRYISKMANYKGKLNKGERILKKMAQALHANSDAAFSVYWSELIKKYPENLQLMSMYAFMLFQSGGQENKTIWALDECLKLKPNLPFVYKFRGYIFLRKEQFEKAEYAFNRYAWLVPDIASPYDSKGDYYMAIKDYDNAIESFRKAYELDNEFTNSLEKLQEAQLYNDGSAY